ncbi:GFA family protein [Pseudomonas sp. 148P]|uniref:GFA family protein n=1 Tax=Pseudomonas ulcerans TaxID=3115852 RepID=A0ABU7HXN5_9PSED|nr:MULTISPECIES: GFA family protein [unclassified Pseudomonas]MEE1920447.1 GFA family protein [Pseudomonas sp. 147P]MEE1936238.1 GFA family protein [Pseudomonas sp. 148P]
MTTHHGSCLCNAIQLSVTLDDDSLGACHCSMCRKWNGGPLLTVHSSQAPQFSGAQPTVFDSSDWAERGFCATCGSHLFYRLKGGNFFAIPVGVLDGEHAWDFNLQVYIDEKPSYYCFSNVTQTMTGAEVVEQFS